MTKVRVGYRMRAISDVVSACPGISKSDAPRAVGLPVRGRGSWRPIERTLRAGLVVEEYVNPRLCRLFASETDRELFHLWQELRHGDPGPERATDLGLAIRVLRAEQAQAYAEGRRPVLRVIKGGCETAGRRHPVMRVIRGGARQ